MYLIVKLNWSDYWQWNWSEKITDSEVIMIMKCNDTWLDYKIWTVCGSATCLESNVEWCWFKVIIIACIWYWVIKHVLWLLNASVCVCVCICDDIIPTEFAAYASQPTFYRERLDSYRFLWPCARKQPMLQPSISACHFLA